VAGAVAGAAGPVAGWKRDFLILWSGQTVSALGTSMSTLVFPLIGYAITGSAALAGLASTGILAGGLVARLPAGALVDRWPRRRVLVLADIVNAVCFASLAAAALAHHLVLTQLVVVGVLSGVAASFAAPAASAALRTVVPPADLPLAYTRLEARDHAAELGGPPLGGALFSVARGLPFLVDAASYLVSALAVTRLRTPLPAPQPSAGRTGVVADVGEGMRFVWGQPVIRAIMLWGALINFAVTLVLVTVTLRLVRAGVHPAAIGLVDAIAAAAGLVGALIAGFVVQRARTGLVTLATGSVVALSVIPMAWTTNVVVIGALLATGTFLLPTNNSGISAYIAAMTPDRLQGRMNAAAGFIASGLLPAGPALAGVLVGTVGGSSATLVGAAATAVSLVPLLATKTIRGLGRPASWAPPPPAAAE
jgi:predicted MFS family arabinose efflux permease